MIADSRGLCEFASACAAKWIIENLPGMDSRKALGVASAPVRITWSRRGNLFCIPSISDFAAANSGYSDPAAFGAPIKSRDGLDRSLAGTSARVLREGAMDNSTLSI